MAVSLSVYPNRAILALGSNVGNWKINFNQCLKKISNFGLITKIGNIYVSKPYGHVQQKNFHNTAIELMTNHSPLRLMRDLQLVERVLKKNKTIILVTHRTSSLSYCDKIFEIQNNEIKEIKKYKNFS